MCHRIHPCREMHPLAAVQKVSFLSTLAYIHTFIYAHVLSRSALIKVCIHAGEREFPVTLYMGVFNG